MAPGRYKEIEDRAVDQVIAMQEGAGLDVVTDGELRRHTFIDQLLEAVRGIDPGPEPASRATTSRSRSHDESGAEQSVFTIPVSVTDKLSRKRMMTIEEYAYARARARRPVKVTLPSPLMLFLAWSPSRTRDAYRGPVRAVRRRADADARGSAGAGADGLPVHPGRRPRLRPADRPVPADSSGRRPGSRSSGCMTDGADMLNEVASVPGVTFGLHICKGNYDSHWISAGGYESMAGRLFPRLYELRPDPARVRERAFRLVRGAAESARRQDRRARARLLEVRRARVARAADRANRGSGALLSRATSSRSRPSAASPQPAQATRSPKTPRRRSST